MVFNVQLFLHVIFHFCQVSSINRVLRNTIGNHVVQENKYQEHEQHQQYRNESSDGSEEDEAQNAYQQTWQPPNQVGNSGPSTQNVLNVDNARLHMHDLQEHTQNYRHSFNSTPNQSQSLNDRFVLKF